MRVALDMFWQMLTSRMTVVAWLVSSGIAAAAGPFGTFFVMTLPLRFAFWAAIIAVAIVIGALVLSGIRTLRPTYGEWQETLVLSLLLTFLFAPVLQALVSVVVGASPDRMTALMEMGAFIVLVPIAITSFRRIVREPRLEREVPEPRRAPRILMRLPEQSGRKLVRISVRDHYVEVVTDKTSETILMRFSDAIAEAEGIPGLQVHRSHWVAEDAVTGVDKEKGRMFLTLIDGSRVPVSRGFRDKVEEAGIADDTAA